MESKKITQLATEVAPVVDDLTFIGDPVTGQLKKVTLNQIAYLFGANPAWGSITGTLSNQTDLQVALNLKADDSLVVHLSGTETITGNKTFSENIKANSTLTLSHTGGFTPTAGYSAMKGNAGGFSFLLGANAFASAYFDFSGNVAQRNYVFPNASGTLALTSDLTGFVTLTGVQTLSNKTFSDVVNLGNNGFKIAGITGVNPVQMFMSNSTSTYLFNTNSFGININNDIFYSKDANNRSVLSFNNTAERIYSFPNASGTIALTSNLTGFITLSSLSATSPLLYNNTTGVFSIQVATALQNGYLSLTDWTTFNSKQPALGFTAVPDTRTLTINGTGYNLSADRSWTIDSMVYPSAGIAVSTGTAWGTSLVDNSANWNTAYSLRLTSATSPLSITSNVISIAQATTGTSGYLTFTDWNTFNNKQDALTNPVTGTGNLKTIALFTTAGSTIGDSNIREDNFGNILINIPTGGGEGYALEVAGDGYFTGDGIFTGNLAGGLDVSLSTTAGHTTTIGSGSVTAYKFNVYGKSYLSDNVLIGTTTDGGYKLAVNGTTNFIGNSTMSSILSIVNAATSVGLNIDRGSATLSNAIVWKTLGVADWFLGSSPLGTSTSDLSLYSYGTASVVLNISRSTGAATFASSVKINQIGSEIQQVINSNASSKPSITQYQVNSSAGWEVGMASLADSYSYIFSYGTFGTTNAMLTLSNTGAATFASSITAAGDIKGTKLTLRDDALENFAAASDTGGVSINYYGYNTGTTYYRDFTIFNGKNSQLFKITGSTGAAAFNNSVTASSLIKSGGTSAQILAADGSVITAGTNITISGGTISASGGGGSTSPAGLNTQIQYNDSGAFGASSSFTWDNTNQALNIINNTTGLRGINIYQNNTGIQAAASSFNKSRGTNASPTAVASGDLIGAFVFKPYISTDYVTDQSLFGACMTSATGVSQFFITGTTASNYAPSLLIAHTGNVSIGNLGGSIITSLTLPSSKLQVVGNVAIGYTGATAAPTNGLIVAGPSTLVGSITTNGGLDINTPTGNSNMNFVHNNAYKWAFGSLATSFNFRIYNYVTGSDPLTILSSNNNIGLGTSTIGSKLQVNGNAAIGYSASTAAPTNGLAVSGAVTISNSSSATYGLDVTGATRINVGATNPILFGKNASYASVPSISMNNTLSDSLMAGFFADGLNFYINSPNRIILRAGGNGLNTNFVIGINSSVGLGYGAYGSDPLSTANSLAVLGLVGIGTNSPSAKLGIIASINQTGISLSSYSLTGANAQSLLDLAGTWNTTGEPTAIKLNITDTASTVNSDLMELQIGGVNQLRVTKDGRGIFTGVVTSTGFASSGVSGGSNIWNFGTITTATAALDTTKYLTINVNGVDYKLALII